MTHSNTLRNNHALERKFRQSSQVLLLHFQNEHHLIGKQPLQRRAFYQTHKGLCNTLNLLHHFLLKSIPIEGRMQQDVTHA